MIGKKTDRELYILGASLRVDLKTLKRDLSRWGSKSWVNESGISFKVATK